MAEVHWAKGEEAMIFIKWTLIIGGATLFIQGILALRAAYEFLDAFGLIVGIAATGLGAMFLFLYWDMFG